MNSTVSSVGRTTVKRGADEERKSTARSGQDVGGLEALLDYAIAEGAQMGFGLFVSILRLARMALKEETENIKSLASQTRSSQQ
ncbi:MAG TPA: hypothetical protein VFX37_00640 [Pseudolabrys sp.]|nr:hypothetical protein [Pseudolabrys sp.]